jgi:hypothetical protein
LKRFLFGVATLVFSVAATVPSQHQPSPEAKVRAMRVSAALGACHASNAERLARSGPNAAAIVDRVMAQCRTQENAVRVEVYRDLGPATAPRVMQAQRAHWRQRVMQIVARARARR